MWGARAGIIGTWAEVLWGAVAAVASVLGVGDWVLGGRFERDASIMNGGLGALGQVGLSQGILRLYLLLLSWDFFLGILAIGVHMLVRKFILVLVLRKVGNLRYDTIYMW